MLIMKDARILQMEGAVGQSLGFAVHAEQTIRSLKRQGVTFTEDDSKIVFHQCPGHLMRPVAGKKNILFTAYEAPDLAPEYIEAGKQADLIICTSDFCAKAYRRALPEKPVARCPLGVDVNLFSYRKRRFPKDGESFVFMWLGAPDERKGWRLIQEAWKHFQYDEDKVLVVKTTGRGKLEKSGNVVVDSRKLSTEDLVKIYHFAHCFMFPSYAEGFGLPLAEAMATGLPCIYTPWGGVTEFATKKTAYPLSYKLMEVEYGIKTVGAVADVMDLVGNMGEVYNNYRRALNKGKNARRRMEQNFTWDDTAKRLKGIITRFLRTGGIQGWH